MKKAIRFSEIINFAVNGITSFCIDMQINTKKEDISRLKIC